MQTQKKLFEHFFILPQPLCFLSLYNEKTLFFIMLLNNALKMIMKDDYWANWFLSFFRKKISILVLTHYSPVLPFYTPWKHQKTFRFSDVFRGYRKATPGCNGLIGIHSMQSWKVTMEHGVTRIIIKMIKNIQKTYLQRN